MPDTPPPNTPSPAAPNDTPSSDAPCTEYTVDELARVTDTTVLNARAAGV
jgi:hypothetical protein